MNTKTASNLKTDSAAVDNKRVLHVGCGMYRPDRLHPSFRDAGFEEVRFDISEDVAPDILGDMRNMDTIKDESFDGLFSSHNLEHVFDHEVVVVLKEFYRVLKKGGRLLITMPDLEAVAKHIAEKGTQTPLYTSPIGPIYPLDVIYGHRPSVARGRVYMAHKTGFSAESLS